MQAPSTTAAKRKGPHQAALCFRYLRKNSALTRFEPRIALADDKHFAATTNDFAVTVAGFC